MKKLDKVLSIVMIVLMVACICSNVFASGAVLNAMTGEANLDPNTTSTMGNIGNTVLTMITNVGIILAIVIVAILGIKYMMGSPEEKSEYKKSMMPYLVGAILVFGASAIGKTVIGLGKSLTNM